MEAPKCKLCGERHWGVCGAIQVILNEAQILAVTKLSKEPKKGRPRIEDKGQSFEATKPWLALGMSRRTWYSRRKEQGK
jgi:hypothetical protein